MGRISFKKNFIVFYFLFFYLFVLFPVDLTFKLTPLAEFPFHTTELKRYDPVGFGGFLDFGVDLFGFFNTGAEIGVSVLPKYNSQNIPSENDQNVVFVPIGLQLGAFFYPFSRLETSFGVAGGACISTTGTSELVHYAPWYRAFADLSFRINPNFSVGGNVSWLITQYDTYWGNPGSSGITAGVSLKYKFDTVKSSKNISSNADFEDSIFPLFYTIYDDVPFGTLTIYNNESAEIRNVRVTFRAENYTASDTLCGTTKQIKRRKSFEVPLYADWNNSILQFSEEGMLPGEVIIEYEILGKKHTSISEIIVPVYNRNQMRWDDPSSIASFISSSAKEVLEFSKVLVGIARNYLRSGLNRNMQFAMYLFDGMALSGIECKESVDTPYKLYHTQSELVDYIQYPFQTMQFFSGDKDDIAVLFMAMLESVGIPAAFIPLEDDIIVCFALGMNPGSVSNYFTDLDKILEIDDDIWIPLSVTTLREGFVNSWYNALQKIDENEEEIELVVISNAWQIYPPSGYSPNANISLPVNEKRLISSVETELTRYISAEIGPKVTELQEKIRREGASIELYNQLGLLYVRAGIYSSAKAVYEVSAKAGSISAMNNLGNICSLEKNYEEAIKWYKEALKLDPNNSTALKNLARLESEME